MSISTDNGTISSKLRVEDHRRAAVLADRFSSNRLEIISAWGDEFEKLTVEKQKAAIAKVRKRHPIAYPRTGRGNRGRNPAFAGI